MSEEARYTLDEASRELAKRECSIHGHDFDVIVNLGGTPQRVICSRCGDSWAIAK